MGNPVTTAVHALLRTEVGRAALRTIVSSRAQAALVSWMARSGEGTDAALRRGALPLPVHFYSPVPDLEDLKRRT